VLNQLDDTNPGTHWTNAEVKHAINVAQRLFCLITLCHEKTVSFTITAGQAFYEISDQVTDFIAPLRVSFNGLRLRADTIHHLDLRSRTWRITFGDPVRYAQHGFDLLAVTPQIASGSDVLSFTYAAEPTEMVADLDVPDIEPDQQIHLEKFAFVYCLLKNGGQELKNGMPFLNEFLDAAAKYASFIRARSRAQRYDNMPIDLSTFERGRFELRLRNQEVEKRGTK
jgi:hypothetical protein